MFLQYSGFSYQKPFYAVLLEELLNRDWYQSLQRPNENLKPIYDWLKTYNTFS